MFLVLSQIGGGNQRSTGFHVKINIRGQIERSDKKLSFGNINHSSAVCRTSINRLLNRSSSQRFAIGSSTEIQNIVYIGFRITAQQWKK